MLKVVADFLQVVEDSLRSIAAADTVTIDGTWSFRNRRAYQRADQLGTGTGPYVDLVDHQWIGEASSRFPFVGMVFAVTTTDLYWAKSRPPATTLDVKLSASGYAKFATDSFTVGLQLGGAGVPGLPVAKADPRDGLVISPGSQAVGVPIRVYQADTTALLVLFLPGTWVAVGRNRLWALRNGLATGLPDPVRVLLTRRRAGHLSSPAVDSRWPA